ncbi:MAG: hypothetical protein HUJ26_23120 [Planctomycetaceae bacterium]|nr:hypothetical protein [Planctomycetaceae bacterium]
MSSPDEQAPMAFRVFFGLFFGLFGGIGLTVLGFLWGAPWNEFGSPPLFIRIFGSFIALGFVMFSAFGIYAAITGQVKRAGSRSRFSNQSSSASDSADDSYHCPSCGAGIGAGEEISPSGDVKCAHCNSWFNVR